MGFTTWTEGTVLRAGSLNTNLLPIKITSNGIYSGSAFNSSLTASGNNTGSLIIAVPAANISGCTYLEICNTYQGQVNCNGAGYAGAVDFRIERSVSGVGVWSDVLGTTNLASVGGYVETDNFLSSLNHLISLTSGDLASGINIRFTSNSHNNAATAGTNFQNIQTYFKTGF